MAAPVEIDVTLLGGFAVRVAGTPVADAAWRRRQAAALVKLLALAPGRRLHREQVIDALWPDEDPAVAAPRLYKAAHFVRNATGRRDAVVVADDKVSLFPGAAVRVDAVVFSELAGRGDIAGALAACRGDLLPADPYEPWLEAHRVRLRLLRVDALRAERRWSELLALEPADEEAHVETMRLHLAGGRPSAALRQFALLETVLRDELGVPPGSAAVALRDEALALQAAAPVAVVGAAPRGVRPATAAVPARRRHRRRTGRADRLCRR
jgi:DNA-binding SARP family transcriptional activator